MNPVLIFRHIECEGPGYLADFLSARNIPYHIVCVDKGESIPASLTGTGGLVFMGGPMSANDPVPWIDAELELIRNAQHEGIPVLGHCLGGQLVSRALGGKVIPNPVREIGWFPVTRFNNKAALRWLAELPAEWWPFHLHGERFTLPAGAVPLLSSRFCPLQAFSMGKTLALQFHVEVTAAMVEEWLQVYQNDMSQPSGSVQTKSEILYDLETRIMNIQQVAEILYARWFENNRNAYQNRDIHG